jgi:hypothetical protein
LNNLGRWSDLVFAFSRTRSASATARLARRFLRCLLGFRLVAADSRRKHVERNGLAAVHMARPRVSPSFAIATVIAVAAIIAARTALAVESVATILTIVARSFGFGFNHLLVAVIIIGVIVALTARILLLKAAAALTQHAEIVVRELEIIFGLDAVARKLRIARHALVFLEQLGGVAALAIILAVARLSAEVTTASLSPTTTPAAALSVVDQMPTSLRSNF